MDVLVKLRKIVKHPKGVFSLTDYGGTEVNAFRVQALDWGRTEGYDG